MFLAPLATFVRIFKKRSTEDFCALPYVCSLFNCMLWVLYGMPFVKPSSVPILTINGFGVALESFYILVFLTFTVQVKKMQMIKWIISVVIAYSIIFMSVLFGLHKLNTRQLATGIMCVVVTVSMYASPLSIMGMVIRTRSVEYMPFLLCVFNFLNGVIWFGYALVTKDLFVAIPNGLGSLFGIVQLVLYALYKNAVPNTQMEHEKFSNAIEVALAHSRDPAAL